MKNLNKLFNPKSIAIVGASPKKGKIGNILAKNIFSGGWKGKLYYVNPKHWKIGNQKCYKNINEIKKPVDLVLIAIPAPLVNEILLEGSKAKPKIENYAIISAGFKETGKSGKKLEENLKIIAETYQLNVLGPNCLGFINSAAKLNASFTSTKIKKGKIAIVSQSGALAVALLDWAEKNEVTFSKAISIGNKTILDEAEIIKYLDKDKETSAIALYLEDVKNGMNFISAISRGNCKKPVAVIKAGKNKAGQRAISSHTGSLAQDENIIKAIFEKFGIIEATSLEQFEDVITQLEYNIIPALREVIILTNAGGPGVLAADYIGKSEVLKLMKIPEKIKRSIRKILPKSASVENPIDLLGDAQPERYQKVLEILSKNFSSNPIVVLLTPQNQTNPEGVANILRLYRQKFSSLSTSFMGGEKIEKSIAQLRKEKIPNFESPERALVSLEEAMKYKNCQTNIMTRADGKGIHLKFKTNIILEKALKEKRLLLSWEETAAIFREYGINLVKSQSTANLKGFNFRKLKFPCVLKADDPQIAHRWEKKAVALSINNEKDFKKAFQKIKRKTGARKFIIQPMQKKGLEMIIGMKRDSGFGPVMILGSGGTFTEIWKDNAILIPPISEKEIRQKIEKLAIYPVLKGFRGEKPYKIKELSNIILAIQNLVAQNPGISEIDINPVILYNNGRKGAIVDAKVFLS